MYQQYIGVTALAHGEGFSRAHAHGPDGNTRVAPLKLSVEDVENSAVDGTGRAGKDQHSRLMGASGQDHDHQEGHNQPSH